MADIKINDLVAYTDPVSTDVLPIVDVGNDLTKKVSIADLLENAGTGTVTAPSFSFDGNNATGIYQPGADQIAITTGGTQRLLISSNGTAEFAGLLKAGTIRPLNADSAAAPGLAIYNDPDTGFFRASSNNLGITTAGVERVRINSTGLLVGGTLPSSPNIELNADGSAEFGGVLSAGPINTSQASASALGVSLSPGGLVRVQRPSNASSNTTVFEAYNGSTSNISLYSGGSAEFAGDIKSLGFLTSSDTTANNRMQFGYMSTPAGTSAGHRIVGDGANLSYYTRQNGSADHIFFTTQSGSSVETLRLKGSDGSSQFAGNVLIGGTLPNSPNIQLKADGNTELNGRVRGYSGFESDRTSSGSTVFVGKLNGTSNIVMTAGGAATFAGGVTSGAWDGSGGSGVGSTMGSAGSFYARRAAGSNASFQLFSGFNGTDQVANIDATGGAQFAGTIKAAGNSGGVDSITAGTAAASKYFVVRGNGTVLGNDNGAATTSDYKYRINSNGSASFAGSVSIGGTAAANTISEYEQGTFTPVVVGGTTAGTITYATNGQAAKYVRIGQTVHIEIYLDVTSIGGATGNYRINGLPFNADNTYFGNGYMRMFATVQDQSSAAYSTNNSNFLFFKGPSGAQLSIQTGRVAVNASYIIQ